MVMKFRKNVEKGNPAPISNFAYNRSFCISISSATVEHTHGRTDVQRGTMEHQNRCSESRTLYQLHCPNEADISRFDIAN